MEPTKKRKAARNMLPFINYGEMKIALIAYAATTCLACTGLRFSCLFLLPHHT